MLLGLVDGLFGAAKPHGEADRTSGGVLGSAIVERRPHLFRETWDASNMFRDIFTGLGVKMQRSLGPPRPRS